MKNLITQKLLHIKYTEFIVLYFELHKSLFTEI